MPFPSGWTTVVHVAGCGDVAFLLERPPIRQKTRLEAARARYPDGSAVPEKGLAVCGTCKEPLEVTDLSVAPKGWRAKTKPSGRSS